MRYSGRLVRAPGLQDKLDSLEARRTMLEREISKAQPPAPRLHPRIADVYREKVVRLREALARPNEHDEAVLHKILRDLKYSFPKN